ncbi:MAG: PEP-CTERM sorting domain-containing protein, partial [Planctomycetes bacterium]|nr:PEP-CTERM sorting domain-containing protein [Planctomycetota bacterium]
NFEIFDWAIFQPNYGKKPDGGIIPEPATLSLLLLGALAFVLDYRRSIAKRRS